MLTSKLFQGLNTIDAVFQRQWDGKIVALSGDRYAVCFAFQLPYVLYRMPKRSRYAAFIASLNSYKCLHFSNRRSKGCIKNALELSKDVFVV